MIILTDLSEVLIRGVHGVDKQIEKYYNIDDAVKFLLRFNETEPLFYECMRGHLTEREYWRVLMGKDKWSFTLDELQIMISTNIALEFSGAMEVFDCIIKYPDHAHLDSAIVSGQPEIWIVSDHIAERREELEMVHPEIFEKTAKQIWSFEYGIIKRDTGFFQHLLLRNHLCQEEVIFIDDQAPNIWNAMNADITSIKYANNEKLETALYNCGFRFSDPN